MPSASRMLVCRRPPAWLILPAIVVPALFGYVGAHQQRNSIEGQLIEGTNLNLVRGGVNNVSVAVDGRDVRLTIPDGVDPVLAKRLASQVDGVGSITVTGPGAGR